MKKMMGLLGILVIAGLIVAGCAPAPSPTPTPTKPAPALPETINIGTHPVGAFFHVIGSAEGAIIGKYSPMKTKIKPVGISSWIPGMVTGEFDMGILNSTDARWAYLGKKGTPYEELSKGKGFPIRLLLTGIYNDVSMFVPAGIPVTKPSELKGHSIAAGFSKTPAVQLQPTAVLANGGLTWDDVKLVPVAAPPGAGKAVMEGRAEIAGSMAVGMPSVQELVAKKGGRILPLNPSPDAKARALEVYPDGYFYQVKGGKFPGVPEDSWLLRYEIYTVVRKDLSDQAVRKMLEVMWEHNSELPSYHKKFKEWTREGYASQKLTVPYHPAAVEFLKEKGLWTDKLERSQEELLAKK